MQAGGAPHIAPHQGFDIELEADGEQQQGDAEIGYLAEGGSIFISHDVKDKTGGQKAEQGGQANQIDYHAATKSHGDQNVFHNRSCKGRRNLPCLTLGW